MKGPSGRWIAGTLILVLLLAGVGFGALEIVELGDELDNARGRLESAEKGIDERDRRLGQAQDELERVRKRLTRVTEDLGSARHSLREFFRLTSKNFCFNDAVGLSSGFLRGSLLADADGDGSDDRVFSVGRLMPIKGVCRYWLVVRSATAIYKARVRAGDLSFQDSSLETYFRPQAAAQLDDRPGAELLIVVHQGAAVEFGVVYTLVNGDLKRLDISDEKLDVFDYSGSLCCGGALNCTDDPGVIVHSSYSRASSNQGYDVTRRFYAVGSSALFLLDSETHYLPRGNLNRFEEFGGYAFSSCPDYRQLKAR